MRKLLLLFCLLPAVASAALRGTATQANTSTSSSITVTVSGIGIQANDIVLLQLNGGTTSETYTYPSGFTAITGLPNESTSTTTMGIACKVATGSEPSSYTVSYSTTDYINAQVRVYSGRTASCSISAVSATAETTISGGNPFSLALTGVTAASGDDVVEFVGTNNSNINGSDTYTFGAPSGFANNLSVFGAVDYSPIIGSADHVNVSSGSTGTITPTLTAAASSPTTYAGYVLSIPEASASSFVGPGGFAISPSN